MFKRRTLFIVGAGASKEVKFPIGPDLAQRVADIRQEGRAMFKPAHHPTIDSAKLIELNNGIRCCELFDFYARSLNAPRA